MKIFNTTIIIIICLFLIVTVNADTKQINVPLINYGHFQHVQVFGSYESDTDLIIHTPSETEFRIRTDDTETKSKLETIFAVCNQQAHYAFILSKDFQKGASLHYVLQKTTEKLKKVNTSHQVILTYTRIIHDTYRHKEDSLTSANMAFEMCMFMNNFHKL